MGIAKTEGGNVGKDLEEDSCIVSCSRKRIEPDDEKVTRRTSKELWGRRRGHDTHLRKAGQWGGGILHKIVDDDLSIYVEREGGDESTSNK